MKAYELWQFASLADDAPKRTRHAAAEPAPGPSAAAVAAHELAVLRETARADGHGAGFAAGRADGLAAAQAEMDHLRRLAAAIAGAYADMQDETAEALLTLALDTARHVLRTELQTQPEAMLPAIREAVDLAGGGAHPQLLLNPGDIGFVQRHLGADLTPGGWRLAEDARIEPGGCRITTTNGAIDSTLKTRWQRVVAALGRNDPWLEAVAVIPAAAPVPPADVVAGPMADEAADPAASLDAEAG